VSGIIESIGSDGYNAGNGGMINISSSSTGDISVAGGNALGGYGGTGGNGGIINLTSSNYGALSAYAGSGGGYGTSGSVGQIYIDGVLH